MMGMLQQQLLLRRRSHGSTSRSSRRRSISSSSSSSILPIRRMLLIIMVVFATTATTKVASGFGRYQRRYHRNLQTTNDFYFYPTYRRHHHSSFNSLLSSSSSSSTSTSRMTSPLLLFLSSDDINGTSSSSYSSSSSSSYSSQITATNTRTREVEIIEEGYTPISQQHTQQHTQQQRTHNHDNGEKRKARQQTTRSSPLSSSSLSPYIIPNRKITIRSINWYCNGMLPLQIYQVLATATTTTAAGETTKLMLSQLLHPSLSSSSISMSSSSSQQQEEKEQKKKSSNARNIDIDSLIKISKSSTATATDTRSSHDTTSSHDDNNNNINHDRLLYDELSHSSKSMLLNYDQLSTKQKLRLVQKIRIEQLARNNNNYYVHPTSTNNNNNKSSSSVSSSSRSPLHVLYVDEHICVTIKPCGIMSVPGPRQNPSLLEYVYHRSVASYDDGYDGDADSDSQDEDNDEDEIPRNRQITRNRRRDQMVVHRLDMGTSGIIVYALTDEALKQLHTDFKCRNVQKTYHALVEGHFLYGSHHLPVTTTTTTTTPLTCVEGEINVALERDPDNPPFMRIAQPRTPETYTEPVLPSTITEDEEEDNTEEDTPKKNHKFWRQAPKDSLTSYTVLSWEYRNGKPVTRIELRPHTGRTHQLRVHCAQGLGHPIVGDEIYGDCSTGDVGNDADPSHIPEEEDEEESHLCLHAQKLCFYHPISRAPMIFEVDPPF